MPLKATLTYLIFSFGGFLDASFLSIKHYLKSPITCGNWEGCETVTASAYATIGTIPIATIGALYYFAIFLLTIAYLNKPRAILIKIITYLTIGGFLVSLYFLFIQAFVLESYCLYCLGSFITSTILFLTSCALYKKNKNL